ncbi:MAG TPA: MFS transporter, partial [Pyrinomonadaceae bacterium]|nr:MFS transporter [Pyrinomonadaceae bacterium]
MTYRELLAGNADFRRLWTGQVVSEVGDWLNNIAVLALVIQFAGEGRVGLSLALYAIARHLPLFLFGPVAGVVVDRADRRGVMIAADLLRAALALGFLLAVRLSSLALIYVVGAALFSVSAFFNAAKRASVPNLVGRADELLAANSLSASTTAATIAAGSALGGVAATALGRDAVFVINALTFVASAEMIRRITKRLRVDKGDAVRQSVIGRPTRRFSVFGIIRRMGSEFREGLRYVRRDAVVSAVFVVVAGWGLGNGAARALYSIFGARLGAEAVAGWASGWPALAERPTDFGISV